MAKVTESGGPVADRRPWGPRDACIVAACVISTVAYFAFSQGIHNHVVFLLDSIDRLLASIGTR